MIGIGYWSVMPCTPEARKREGVVDRARFGYDHRGHCELSHKSPVAALEPGLILMSLSIQVWRSLGRLLAAQVHCMSHLASFMLSLPSIAKTIRISRVETWDSRQLQGTGIAIPFLLYFNLGVQ